MKVEIRQNETVKNTRKSVARFLRLTAALVSFIKETTMNKLSISDYDFFSVVSTSFVSVF